MNDRIDLRTLLEASGETRPEQGEGIGYHAGDCTILRDIMKNVATYPKITKVQTKPGKMLLVEFDNGDRRVYDCKPLLDSEVFRPLEDETLFRCAHADTHGYGIIWNDAIDLAESEIWLNGQPYGPEEPSDT